MEYIWYIVCFDGAKIKRIKETAKSLQLFLTKIRKILVQSITLIYTHYNFKHFSFNIVLYYPNPLHYFTSSLFRNKNKLQRIEYGKKSRSQARTIK